MIPLVVLVACGAKQQSSETLVESIRSYNDGMRWQRFAVAATLVPPRERSKFVEDMDERAEDLRITDYEVVKVDRKGAKEAEVQVKVSWYKDSEGTLRETHARQTWERHGENWLIVDTERMRGAEMPGLPDGQATPEPATEPGTDGDPGSAPGPSARVTPGP
ncbi:MAG: hypothetical protein H0X17_08805 [Deltaproteobacteria bacterium]|nr:hypothetical protein [Deltaproteobacteria bacterium]